MVLVVPLVVLAVFVGALTRATFGFGEAIVSMPLLLLVPQPLMSAALGTVLVGYAAYALLPTPPVRVVHPSWAYPTGLLAGALGSAYNFNGVPVVVFGTLRPSPSPPSPCWQSAG